MEELGVSVDTSAVDVVIPVWRPQLERLRQIVASALDQDVPTRVVLVHDGPDEQAEQMLRALCDEQPRARYLMAPRSGTDTVTRQSVLDRDTTEALVFIDDDVLPTKNMVGLHVAALEGLGGIVMGRLRTVIPPKRDPLRPGALVYDRWYQDARRHWRSDPSAAITWFWAGNLSASRATIAQISRLMPGFESAYGFDGFYGLIADKLGIRVSYHDDIIADHFAGKPPDKIPAIGYSAGRSVAIMARGVESIWPAQAEKFRAQITRFDKSRVLTLVALLYGQHPERPRTALVRAASWSNSWGFDKGAVFCLEIAHMLELTRGYAENDMPNAASKRITAALLAATLAGSHTA